ncbi:MAG: LuxR C-terminal-related transcriptional regulator [Devosiaceae bacterium]|nr:LuxR C-terminal-related transcriptional regulator [Devosiaceae bacterium]
MIELEKLYECAGNFLSGEQQDWDGFAKDFSSIFGTKFVLYRPSFKAGVLALRSMEGIVATTDPEMVEQYVKDRIFDLNQIPDDSLNPLEPNRRSDIMPDEIFRNQDVVKKYFIPNGIFYMLAVLAIEQNDGYLMLVSWRDESGGDFSDMEKQRMALFMRYLCVLVEKAEFKKSPVDENEIKDFGRCYDLTSAETGILSGLLQGKSLRQIASDSGRSYGTVRWHVRNLLNKCQVSTQQTLLSEFYRLIKR